jgi:hypothetical protein
MTDHSLSTETSSDAAQADSRDFEDLSLAEALSQFLHAPATTLRALRDVASTPRSRPGSVIGTVPVRRAAAAGTLMTRARSRLATDRRAAVLLSLRFMAYVLAWWGCGVLANTPQRTELTALNNGAPLLILGFLLWLGAEIYRFMDHGR